MVGRRYSLDDAFRRHVREELEGAAERQRQSIAREAELRSTDIERAVAEQREGLEAAAAEKTAEIISAAAEQRTALEEALHAQFQALHGELIAEGRRIHEITRERIEEARSRFAARETERVTAHRVLEIQNTVREQIALLDELDRVHASMSEQLSQARALAAGALRGGIESLGRDVVAALQESGAIERPSAPTKAAQQISKLAQPVESPLLGSTPPVEEAEPQPIHWRAPPVPQRDGL
jgi:hypothetical protein